MSATLARSAAGLGMASERTRLRMVARLREQGITDEVVLAAMAQVPRHLFVEEALASRAYEDTALPIGFAQTISQPWVVARSCELARAGRMLDLVLEIGGGCGYQAAVLARLAREVYTIERIGALAARARQTLAAAGIGNVKVRNADGRDASSNVVQFDAIVVAAASATIPPNLPSLLADGGRLVIPLGGAEHQRLTRLTRHGEQFERETFDDVVFVPLKSGQE
ncbi:MAG: protein-L-isoaspartate(D-aspartate) O-methyltransferase [Burkholderiales bacterium]|nr:protein-L-isoaspartate(D-aspartate) O-methyltransferase [Pseudomonadota bacterium]MCC7067836.1 protein-L-isoaspartate(D-aspartate) O-methyltransferase [Burkholderiales bacterium]MCZ2135035.1 protein-L-isoaspartate(D-aspartate) O-methyltransferase [Burkholderiales bacterium]